MNPLNQTSALACRAVFAAVLAGALALPVAAEEDPSLVRPDKGKFDPQDPPPHEVAYHFSDAPATLKDDAAIKSRGFTLKTSVISILDYTSFSQDDANVRQVGRVDDEFQVRALRVIVRGAMGDDQKLKYFIATEFNGFNSGHTNEFTLVDAYLAYPIIGPQTKLMAGKFKETFSYEMVGDAANLPQQERVLSPFFVSRSVGVKLNYVGPEERFTATVGAFNDSWVSSAWDGAATDFSGRITTVLGDARGEQYLHLGAAVRRVGAGDDTLRFRGRPQTNAGPNFVDTGKFTGDHAWNYGLEALWNTGPFSLLFEQIWSVVDAGGSGDPVFSGSSLTGSWFLTGDHRPYDPTVGYARRVQPLNHWGALEFVARASQVDLNGGAIRGGEMKNIYTGLNWWATERWKIGVGWTHNWLDRSGETGHSDSILTRLQWVF